ncbi:MAG: FAD-dependent thymidylate synthase [bacterium]|nr:FAD-dependent thymidylate synthase [bacterium]
MDQKLESITRASVPAIDEILGRPWPVLSEGFIRVIDYMGSDQAIVQAARISYGKGTKQVQQDSGLIRYLLRNRHTSPFEMCELKLHIRVPMDCWRQWIRHRTASVNEYSTRYSEAISIADTTQPDEWRLQSGLNKQGSDGCLDAETGARLSLRETEHLAAGRALYEERVELGVAREQARKDLPLSTYTEVYWKIDLHNLLHFLALRMDHHAQLEIRAYADIIGNEIVARWCPHTWEAYQDYRANALPLSSIDVAVFSAIGRGDDKGAIDLLVERGMLPPAGEPVKRNRERIELEEKARRLGIKVPW